MHICDLNQEQCKSRQFQWVIQTCSMLQIHQNTQEYQNDGLNPNSLNFNWQCKREGLEKKLMHMFLYWFTQTWATSSLSRQPEPDFALFQKIYKVYTLTLSKYAKTHTKDSWITQESHQHNKTTLADLENHHTHTKLEKDQTSVVTQPCLPQTPSPKFKTKQNAPRMDLRSTFTSCNLYDHERERIPRFP